MMDKKIRSIAFGVFLIFLLAACAPAAQVPNTSGTGFQANTSSTGTRQSGQFGQFGQSGGFGRSRTPTVAPTPLPTDTPFPTPTVVSPTDLASATAQNYFAAIQKGDYAAASQLVSAFSLRVANLTAGDAAAALAQQNQGATWSNFQVVDSKAFDNQTILVHVTYQVAAKDSKTGQVTTTNHDELWPVRLEVGKWLYNWGNLIDFHTLEVTPQTTAGLTIDPLTISRYTDRMVMTVLAQNNTNDPIVIGSQNQVLASFQFAGKTVPATNTRYIIDSLRSYTNIEITIPGLMTNYPDSVQLIQYTNYKVAPWFTFTLN